MERARVVVAGHSTKNWKKNIEINLLPLPRKRKPTYLFSVCGGNLDVCHCTVTRRHLMRGLIPHTMWVPRIKIRSSDLEGNAFTC